MKNILFLLLLAIAFSFSSYAQKKKEKAKAKIARDTSYVSHRANRAALYSAILPGAGQIYNKSYWKVPILYGGFTVLGLVIEFNNKEYKIFRKAYQYRVDTLISTVDEFDPSNPNHGSTTYPDASSLLIRRDYYRRTRDLMWIIGSIVYVLNIVDAYVDAHLSNFDISDNLSMKARPSIDFIRYNEPVASLKVSLNLH